MQLKSPTVYILASRRNGTLYIGVTSNLASRVSIHKQDILDGFTKRYGVHLLVYVEHCDTMEAAIRFEKKLKKLRRADKIAMIEKGNQAWRDLYEEISGFINTDDEPRSLTSSSSSARERHLGVSEPGIQRKARRRHKYGAFGASRAGSPNSLCVGASLVRG